MLMASGVRLVARGASATCHARHVKPLADGDVGAIPSGRGDTAKQLGSGVLLALCGTVGNPLPVTCCGNFLLAHRAGLRFVDVPADALDVVGLRGAMGQRPRGPVSMVGHGPLLSGSSIT
jgi:hypothetical protein